MTWLDLSTQIGLHPPVVELPDIDFSKLPRSERDSNERIAYGRAVQILLCDEKKLGLYDEDLAAAKSYAAQLFPEHYARKYQQT